MRHLLAVGLSLGVTACACGRTCDVDADCDAGACDRMLGDCVERDAGGGAARLTGLVFLSPDGGATAQMTVPVVVSTTPPGFDAGPSMTVMLTGQDAGAMAMLGASAPGVYTGQTPVLSEGTWRADVAVGGIDASVRFLVDRTAPAIDVQVVAAPTYGSDGGFLGMDPAEGGGTIIKKDELVVLRVTAPDSDVRAASLSLAVTVPVDGGLETWDAGAAAACGAAQFCRDFTLALGPQALRDFSAAVNVLARVDDDVGNAGVVTRNGLFRVTRWKWARLVSGMHELRGAPAIGQGGDVFLPARASSSGGVFRVSPTGVSTQESSAGPVEGGVAIGRDSTTQHVFFLPTNDGLRSLGATQGCGPSSVTNVSSLAILNDGQSTMRGVGVVGDMGTRQLVALQPGIGCREASAVAPQAASVAVPGNVVIHNQDVWYPATGGAVKRFTVGGAAFNALADITGIGAGTIYGLSLFANGTRLGGGGGAGVGRLFVRPSDGSGSTTGYSMMAHVTGAAVGAGASLFAVTEAAEVGTLRKFDMTGDTVLASATLPVTFSFPFLEGVSPGATTPVLGAGGWVYATANNGNVVAADQQGLEVKWLKALPAAIGGQVVASPTLDCNRTASASGTGAYYFATTSGWLVAYIVDSAGLDLTAAWPKFQHDARNTGNTAVSLGCP